MGTLEEMITEGPPPDFSLILCAHVLPIFKADPFISFGRSFPGIRSVLCPIKITVTGTSIKDVSKRGGGSSENWHTNKNEMTCFSYRKSGQRGGGQVLPSNPDIRYGWPWSRLVPPKLLFP